MQLIQDILKIDNTYTVSQCLEGEVLVLYRYGKTDIQVWPLNSRECGPRLRSTEWLPNQDPRDQ